MSDEIGGGGNQTPDEQEARTPPAAAPPMPTMQDGNEPETSGTNEPRASTSRGTSSQHLRIPERANCYISPVWARLKTQDSTQELDQEDGDIGAMMCTLHSDLCEPCLLACTCK